MNYVKRHLSTTIAFGLAATFVTLASSQCLGQEKATTPIVVLDLSKVFDSHVQFKAKIDRIKAMVQAEETKIQQTGEAIKKRVEQLAAYQPSSPEYKSLEEETARMQGQVQADMALKRKGFLEQEAKVYFDTYEQVKREVKAFAESNRIGIVLRYSSDEIDSANRQSVLQGINQPIVYNQGGLDITSYIIDRLQRSGGAAATATTGQQRR